MCFFYYSLSVRKVVKQNENRVKVFASFTNSKDNIFLPGGFEGFHSTIDPEELFRKIFGDAGFKMGGGGGGESFADFAESQFGFAPASEVSMALTFAQVKKGYC